MMPLAAELPLTLRPGRVTSAALVLAPLALTLGSILILNTSPIMACISLLFFGLLTVLLLCQCLAGGPCLQLTLNGFSIRGWRRNAKEISWVEVAGFTTMRAGMLKRVAWAPAVLFDGPDAPSSLKAMTSIKMLPSNFGLQATELAALMNTLRLQALGDAAA